MHVGQTVGGLAVKTRAPTRGRRNTHAHGGMFALDANEFGLQIPPLDVLRQHFRILDWGLMG